MLKTAFTMTPITIGKCPESNGKFRPDYQVRLLQKLCIRRQASSSALLEVA